MSLPRELESLSLRLGANVRPGHVDYISKARASEFAAALVKDADECFAENERLRALLESVLDNASKFPAGLADIRAALAATKG